MTSKFFIEKQFCFPDSLFDYGNIGISTSLRRIAHSLFSSLKFRFTQVLFVGAVLLLSHFETKAQSTLTAVVVADFETWINKGDLTEADLHSKMKTVASSLTNSLFQRYQIDIETEIPDENLIIIKNVDEDNINLTPWGGGNQGGANKVVQLVNKVFPLANSCIDVVIFLEHGPGEYSGRERINTFDEGAVVLAATWNARDDKEIITAGNIVGHEIGHGFGLLHNNAFPGREEEWCLESPTTENEFWAASSTCGVENLPWGAQATEFAVGMMCSPHPNLFTEVYFSSCVIHPNNLGIIESYIQDNPLIFNPPNSSCTPPKPVIAANVEEIFPDLISCENDNIFTYTTTIFNPTDTDLENIYILLAIRATVGLTEPNIFIENEVFTDVTTNLDAVKYRSITFNLAKGEQKQFSIDYSMLPDNPQDRIQIFNSIFKVDPNPNSSDDYLTGDLGVDLFPRNSISIVENGDTRSLSSLIANETISADEALNQDWLIDGTLIIDEDYKLLSDGMIPALLSMADGAKIIVNDAKLTIDGIDLKNCQNSMWQGIELANAELDIQGSSIFNAETGISSDNNSMVTTINCEFYNNHIAIDITGGSDLNQFFGNNIHSNGNLLSPYAGKRTEAGLILNDNEASVLGVTSPIGNGSSSTNYFRGLKNGIQADNCNILLQNSEFSDITNNGVNLSHSTISCLILTDMTPIHLTILVSL